MTATIVGEADVVARTPILELRGVSKRFGAVQALTDVDFEVYEGEVVALVGDNGAGKSTLIKAIAGTHAVDSGEVRFVGQPVKVTSPQVANALGIATVYQDLSLCDNLDVVANLYLGRESVDPTRVLLDELAMESESVALMQRLAVRIPNVRTPVAALSGGQRQSIAVARATLGSPKIVVLDEPTAALGVVQTAQVLELIRTLRAENLGVVVISHNLADVFEVADRIVVLRLGRKVATFKMGSVTREEVVAAITGATANEDPNEEDLLA
jgi:D-xylose transport system ATP-binding protein